MKKETGPDAVSSVLKVFAILEILSEQKYISVTELSQKLMMSKSTTYRFLQTMINLGFVKQEAESEKYGLTLKLFEVGARSLEYTDLIDLADKEMQQIANITGETLHLGVLDGDEIMYLHKIDSKYALRMHSRVGRKNPVYSTAIGKVLLSNLSDQAVVELCKEIEFVKHTENTLSNVTQLIDELNVVREQHFAQDNEEQEQGLRCIAVPIYNRFGKIIASISLSLPTIRFKVEEFAELVGLLHTAGRNISETLGYHHYPVQH